MKKTKIEEVKEFVLENKKKPKKERLSQNALAFYIYKTNPKRYLNKENVRSKIRIIEGSRGESSRRLKKYKDFHKKLTHNTHPIQIQSDEIGAKILILDIETAPLLANIWGIWNQNINLKSIHSDWFMLTWAAKWLFEKKVYSARVTPKEAIENNDKRIVKSLIEMLNQADVVIGHNCDKFDLPRVNTRSLVHRIPPPFPFRSIDTLKIAKRDFAFTSNQLDFINKTLRLPQKTETDMKLWRDCFIGKEAGLKKMEKYNVNDVLIQEQTYLTMRPYIKSHPNMGLHIVDDGHEHCPSCGCKDIKYTGKSYQTSLNTYDAFRCCNCGSIGRKRKANKKSKTLTSSVAR